IKLKDSPGAAARWGSGPGVRLLAEDPRRRIRGSATWFLLETPHLLGGISYAPTQSNPYCEGQFDRAENQARSGTTKGRRRFAWQLNPTSASASWAAPDTSGYRWHWCWQTRDSPLTSWTPTPKP